MSSHYTSKTNIEAYLHVSIPATLNDFLNNVLLPAVDVFIENYIGRSSFKDPASSVRYYDGEGGKELYIDEFTGPMIEVCFLDGAGDVTETLSLTDDFDTYPMNDTGKFMLRLKDQGRYYAWPEGARRVKLTATWGHTTPPADIVLVATKIAANELQVYLKGGKTQSESVGDTSFTFANIDQNAEALGIYNTLNSYRLPTL